MCEQEGKPFPSLTPNPQFLTLPPALWQGHQQGTYTKHVKDHCPLSSVLVGEDVIGELVQGCGMEREEKLSIISEQEAFRVLPSSVYRELG